MNRSLIIVSSALALGAAVASKSSFFSGVLKESSSRNPPLDVDLVVEKVADYLWSDGRTFPFIIKGSYACAVRSYEQGHERPLPYNDIDVYFKTQVPIKACPTKTNFVKSAYVKDIIPISDITVQLSAMCELDAKEVIKDDSDINAVNVGFTVVPKKKRQAGRLVMVPQVESWELSAEFEEFLQTKQLALVDRVITKQGHPGQSVVRLLRKAQELQMEYRLPEQLENMLHGTAMPSVYKNKLDKLRKAYKNQVNSRFDLVRIRDGARPWYMFVRKGAAIPEPPRLLAQNSYDYGYDDPAGGGGGGGSGGSSSRRSIGASFLNVARAGVVAAFFLFP